LGDFAGLRLARPDPPPAVPLPARDLPPTPPSAGITAAALAASVPAQPAASRVSAVRNIVIRGVFRVIPIRGLPTGRGAATGFQVFNT
jgi:hypothetical protein